MPAGRLDRLRDGAPDRRPRGRRRSLPARRTTSTLFLNGITEAVNGQSRSGARRMRSALPIAADVGLTTLAGGFELIVHRERARHDLDRGAAPGSPVTMSFG